MSMALRVVGVGLTATVLLLVWGQFQQRSQALVVRIAAAVVLLLVIMVPLGQVVAALGRVAELAHVRGLYLALLLKVLGIAYLATLGAEIARDAGEGALANKVELAGKVLILVLAVPVLTAIVQLLFKMMPG
jgi:stage III sporulation protein AD